jgi:hypothetical protein
MNTVNKYTSYVLIAALAGSAGWGFSALASRHDSNAVSSQPEAAPAATAEMAAHSSNSAFAEETVKAPTTRSRVAGSHHSSRQVARNESRETSRSSAPAYERKKGMSNKTKTIIAIGGGAATGAAIGGIAGGGKGAGIGALAGGGAGAIYSLIRHKQNKPVW